MKKQYQKILDMLLSGNIEAATAKVQELIDYENKLEGEYQPEYGVFKTSDGLTETVEVYDPRYS